MAKKQAKNIEVLRAPTLRASNDEFNELLHHYVINSYENILIDVDMEQLKIEGKILWNGQEFTFTSNLTEGE